MHSICLSLAQYNEVSLLSLHNIKGIARHEGAYVKWTISKELVCFEPLFIYQHRSFSFFSLFFIFFRNWLSKRFHGKQRGRQLSRATEPTQQCAFRTLLFLPLFFFVLLFLNSPGLKLNSLHQHMAKVEVRQIKRFIAPKNG